MFHTGDKYLHLNKEGGDDKFRFCGIR